MMRKITPSKEILDFTVLGTELASEEKFRNEIQKICGDEKLPIVFPALPDYFKARNEGLVTNVDFRDSELSLPAKLYSSETYESRPELRGAMEEIILAFENERIRQGLPKKVVVGDSWSPTFVKRFEKIHDNSISLTEIREGFDNKDNEFGDKNIKGTKLG